MAAFIAVIGLSKGEFLARFIDSSSCQMSGTKSSILSATTSMGSHSNDLTISLIGYSACPPHAFAFKFFSCVAKMSRSDRQQCLGLLCPSSHLPSDPLFVCLLNDVRKNADYKSDYMSDGLVSNKACLIAVVPKANCIIGRQDMCHIVHKLFDASKEKKKVVVAAANPSAQKERTEKS